MVGLKLSNENCQWISSEFDASLTNIEIEGKQLELVQKLVFFGTTLNFDDANDVELNHRISKGWTSF